MFLVSRWFLVLVRNMTPTRNPKQTRRVVRTVLGDIQVDALGVCYPHEHLFGKPPVHLSEPDFELTDRLAAILEMQRFRDAGGSAVVDMSTLDYNRDIQGLIEVSEKTGIHVISATGFNKDKFSKPYIEQMSDQEMYDLFFRDTTTGIEQTTARAGVLKASSTLNEVSDAAHRVFDVVSAVHRDTGVPVSTHTEIGTMALEQVELLTSKGVPPASIIIGHLDRRLEEDYILEVAATGVFLGFDQISKEKYFADRTRIEMILTLIEAGHEDQILLSGDLARRSYWPSYGNYGGPGFTYILWRFIPWLREAGVDVMTINKLLVQNPAHALSLVPV